MKPFSSDGSLRPLEVEAAQYFPRDGGRNVPRSVGIGVEPHHAQRITMLPRDQIGDGGFIVGAVEAGLREGRAEPAIAVDDDVITSGAPGTSEGQSRIPLCGQSYTGRDGLRTGVYAKQGLKALCGAPEK